MYGVVQLHGVGGGQAGEAAPRDFRIGVIDFRDGPLVGVRTESYLNGPQIGVVAVRRDLDAGGGDTGAKVVRAGRPSCRAGSDGRQ